MTARILENGDSLPSRGRVDTPVFLDRIPSSALLRSAECDLWARSSSISVQELTASLKAEIGSSYGLTPNSILVFSGIDSALRRIARSSTGPIAVLPPSELASQITSMVTPDQLVPVARGAGRTGAVNVDDARDIAHDTLVVADSPTNPLGALLSAADGVRLARASQLLVIDERFAEIAGFSLLPLAIEFENVVVLRTLQGWAEPLAGPCCWAAGSPGALRQLQLNKQPAERQAIAGALAVLRDRHTVDIALRCARDERSRLFRLLRKYSLFTPLPSWGPFLSARVEVVPRDALVNALRMRGVHIHAPQEPGLERFVRIGIGPRHAMERLCSALLEIVPELIGERATPRSNRHESPRVAQ